MKIALGRSDQLFFWCLWSFFYVKPALAHSQYHSVGAVVGIVIGVLILLAFVIPLLFDLFESLAY